MNRSLLRFAATFIAAAVLATVTVRIARSLFDAHQEDATNRIVPALSVDSELSRLLSPRAAGAWQDLPVAAFQPHLGADEIVYRQFDAPTPYQVFAARWRPGNPNAGEAASHPPEACWQLTGWRCTDARSAAEFHSESAALKPGEWRRFVGPYGRQEALFWCVAGEQVVPQGYHGDAAARAELDSIWDLFRQSGFLCYWWARWRGTPLAASSRPITFRSSGDVVFVRINSSLPLQTVLDSDQFRPLQSAFAALGLLEQYKD